LEGRRFTNALGRQEKTTGKRLLGDELSFKRGGPEKKKNHISSYEMGKGGAGNVGSQRNTTKL